jgi:hypothetical protein
MSNLPELRKRHEQRVFNYWDGQLPVELVGKSEDAMHALIGRLLALGPKPTAEQVHLEMEACVQQFNELDSGWVHPWIMTVEREDICEELMTLVDLCGYVGSSDEWIRGRGW